jgi:hypothetical protein
MALQIQGNGGTVQEVGGTTFRGANIHVKPLEYGALGHYATSVRISSTAAQAANSGIFEIRNTHATNLIIPTRLNVSAIQTAAGTLQENSLDLYRCTAFSASSTTNTVTPVTSVKRTSMAAYPGGAAIRHLTLAGNAAGMTGFTRTKDTQFFATFPYMVTAGVATATYQPPQWGPKELIPNDGLWECPFVFAQNEGLWLENRVLNVTSMGITWYIDFAWAEVTAF